jgi:hypothetical protein
MTETIDTGRAAPRLSCPDCTARADTQLIHDATCPLLAGVEAVCARDEAWFRSHPHSRWRFRDLWPAERAEIGVTGHQMPAGTRVRVVDLGGGRHVRQFACRRVVLLEVLDLPPARGWAT